MAERNESISHESYESGEAMDVFRQKRLESEALLMQLKVQIADAESVRSNLADIAVAVQNRLKEIEGAASAAIAGKTQISDDQAVVAAKSAHIQGAQEHADKVRVELDRIQTVAAQLATEAEGHRSRAQSANDSAAELLAAIRGHRTATESDLAATETARDVAKAAAETTKLLAEKSMTIENRLSAYELRLNELQTKSESQLETITGLLPGATAAGLAHAFDDRRKTFLNPSIRWQWLFVGSVIALIVLALTGLWSVYKGDSILGWDDLARLWLARLPIAGALIWIALHASRESALAKRLEEDYGYKAAIAASFLGFQRQMAEIGEKAPNGSPLAKLCSDTLSTIASPPGRIYDKHRLTITPASEFASAASKAIGQEKLA